VTRGPDADAPVQWTDRSGNGGGTSNERAQGAWFNEIAEFLGPAYPRNAVTKDAELERG
jgi:hypothetical protein